MRNILHEAIHRMSDEDLLSFLTDALLDSNEFLYKRMMAMTEEEDRNLSVEQRLCVEAVRAIISHFREPEKPPSDPLKEYTISADDLNPAVWRSTGRNMEDTVLLTTTTLPSTSLPNSMKVEGKK